MNNYLVQFFHADDDDVVFLGSYSERDYTSEDVAINAQESDHIVGATFVTITKYDEDIFETSKVFPVIKKIEYRLDI